jgi:coenzyme PQQ precursor peptide PqqA
VLKKYLGIGRNELRLDFYTAKSRYAHRFFIGYRGPVEAQDWPFVAIATTAKGLMPHCFDLELSHNPVNCLCGAASLVQQAASKKFNWRTFRSALLYRAGRISSEFEKESRMAWKAPKIVEVSVGMEINMYMCATRK